MYLLCALLGSKNNEHIKDTGVNLEISIIRSKIFCVKPFSSRNPNSDSNRGFLSEFGFLEEEGLTQSGWIGMGMEICICVG